MNSSIKELKDSYVREFYPDEMEPGETITFDGTDFSNDKSGARIFNDFDMDDIPKYDSNRPTDYSQGDDYHAYVSLNLQKKEKADVKENKKSKKNFKLKGKYRAKHDKYLEKYCLHNYCSDGTLNTIRKEYSNYLVSKKLTKPSIIKTTFKNPQRILQNYRYIPYETPDCNSQTSKTNRNSFCDISSDTIGLSSTEYNPQTSITDFNSFYANAIDDSFTSDKHCGNSSDTTELDSNSSMYTNSSSEPLNQSNENDEKKPSNFFKTFWSRLVSKKTPTPDQPKQDIMTNEVSSNYPTSSETLKHVNLSETNPKEKSLIIKEGTENLNIVTSVESKMPRIRNPVTYLFNQIKRRRNSSPDNSETIEDKYESKDTTKSLLPSPVKTHFNGKLTFLEPHNLEINDELVDEDVYISQPKLIITSVKRPSQPELNGGLTFQEPYKSEENLLLKNSFQEDNEFDSNSNPNSRKNDEHNTSYDSIYNTREHIFSKQHVVIDGLEYFYFEWHFEMTTYKTVRNFKKVMKSLKSSSMFSSNLQMWLNVFRPSLDLLWNFYLDCPKANMMLKEMQEGIFNIFPQVTLQHEIFLENKDIEFPDEHSTDVLYMASTIFTINLIFFGVLCRLQDVTGFRRLLKDIFYETFKRFESEVMHYPFLDYHFTY